MSEPLKLDVGCGGKGSRQPGFVGIDIHPRPPGKNGDEYLRLDFVNEPLPWADGTVDEIIALHMIEHLTHEDGHKMVCRALKLLKPEGLLTITCPDLFLLCRKYMECDVEFWERKARNDRDVWPGATIGDRFNWAVHEETHQWSYDFGSLRSLVCQAANDVGIGIGADQIWSDNPYHCRQDHETGIVVKRLA